MNPANRMACASTPLMAMTKLQTESYQSQATRWPQHGRVILAHFDADSIVVYQAYKEEIGKFAARHGYFGGAFSFSRMSWIKPNFLWMMYRSGWGTKQDQEISLAVRLKRGAFDEILNRAVPSSFDRHLHSSKEEWENAVATSEIRLQWDPDHDPSGRKLERRAIQLGIRGAALQRYAREWIIEIEDISDFVAEQRQHAIEGRWSDLQTPVEEPYPWAEAPGGLPARQGPRT